ncbi:DUF4149 domain-containing protein [Chondromyces apiculatus]|uniref:TMEM205-like domain-containing protein n=1 Tax=Chondromyces apiculatus DSM 436 TaxID=1192034 RepID=A0A017TBJ5_9BACT|nr:DUF4149 domain-containing protein [Chondromyces apiculatus]EYF06297.1 Hypothetical protein CAP_2175 [Chondromyces apiculatus DSM 436]
MQPMGEEEHRFTEADLEPSPEERSAARRMLVERAATTAGVLAAGVWAGGLVALGFCAAPFVFRMTPAPFSGDAMGAAFARFDQIALGSAVVLLGAEVVRTWAARRHGRTVTARVRRFAAMLLAAMAAYMGLILTPRINDLHRAGAQRGQGAMGAELEQLHQRAEKVSQMELLLLTAAVALHVFTLGARRPEDEEEDEVSAPLPPGPRGEP